MQIVTSCLHLVINSSIKPSKKNLDWKWSSAHLITQSILICLVTLTKLLILVNLPIWFLNKLDWLVDLVENRWFMLLSQRCHLFPKKFGKFRYHLKYERKKYGILIFLIFDFYSDEIIIKS